MVASAVGTGADSAVAFLEGESVDDGISEAGVGAQRTAAAARSATAAGAASNGGALAVAGHPVDQTVGSARREYVLRQHAAVDRRGLTKSL